jgi:hypothetical protein
MLTALCDSLVAFVDFVQHLLAAVNDDPASSHQQTLLLAIQSLMIPSDTDELVLVGLVLGGIIACFKMVKS